MDFLKTVGGKIVSGLVAVAVIAIAISWWQMEPETRTTILHHAGVISGWLILMIVVPWATFFAIGWVAKLEKNWAGALLILAYTAIEATLLAWMFAWKIHGATAVVFFAAAVLLAGAYNLFVCDWIAEKLE